MVNKFIKEELIKMIRSSEEDFNLAVNILLNEGFDRYDLLERINVILNKDESKSLGPTWNLYLTEDGIGRNKYWKWTSANESLNMIEFYKQRENSLLWGK